MKGLGSLGWIYASLERVSNLSRAVQGHQLDSITLLNYIIRYPISLADGIV